MKHKIFIPIALVLGSCMQDKPSTESGHTPFAPYINPIGHELLVTTKQLFIDKQDTAVIQIICTTNLPQGAVVEIYYGNWIVSTIPGATITHNDLMIIKDSIFNIHISPATIPGFLTFRVNEKGQPESILQALKQADSKIAFPYEVTYDIRYITDKISVGKDTANVFFIAMPE